MSAPSQTRVIATKPRIGTRPAGSGPAPVPEPETPKRSRTGLVVVLLVVLLAGGAAAWWFLLGPGAASDETPEAEQVEVAAPDGRPEGEPGDVVETEAISINLADGHYLRLGLGLQLNASVDADVSTAQALDAAIELFSGRPVAEVTSAEGRAALKDELMRTLWEVYDGAVLDVYLTDFVTQ